MGFIWLWLLIAIMKRCAERCLLQLYRTSLKFVMNIVKCVNKNPKKRELIGNSSPEEERKKITGGSSTSTAKNCDIFK